MLVMNYEFKRGFFFVRLSGKIDKYNYDSFMIELDNIIIKTGLNKIVININNVKNMSNEYMDKILNYIKKCSKKNILIFICDSNTIIGDTEILKINCEREVYNYI